MEKVESKTFSVYNLKAIEKSKNGNKITGLCFNYEKLFHVSTDCKCKTLGKRKGLSYNIEVCTNELKHLYD